jgi:hypothetical protein
MSKRKTCVECRYQGNAKETGLCEKRQICLYPEELTACTKFEPIVVTYGDRIRQMVDADLAEMLVYPVKPMNINGDIHYEFTSCLLLGKSYPMREQAVALTEKRLNAPAESEVNNGQ